MIESKKGAARRPGNIAAVPAAGTRLELLDFKVSTEVKKGFKGYAVSQYIAMIELLTEAFELGKRKRNP